MTHHKNFDSADDVHGSGESGSHEEQKTDGTTEFRS